MLGKRIEKWITDSREENGDNKTIELYQEEMEFAKKRQLVGEGIKIVEKAPAGRFDDAYLERGDKETDEFLGEENASFLDQPIQYFKKHKNEFMYMESKWFELVGVDAVSYEVDDVFGTYNAMLGLKLQKKFDQRIKSFFAKELGSEDARVDLMFDANEGIWNVNFALNNLAGFKEEMTIREAYMLIYQFLFKLGEAMEKDE